MKKLIAMLLCIAMIAAFGAQAFATVGSLPPTRVTPSQAEQLADTISNERDLATSEQTASDNWNRLAVFFNSVEAIAEEAGEAAIGANAVRRASIFGDANDRIAALAADNADLTALVAGNNGRFQRMAGAVNANGEWNPNVLNVVNLLNVNQDGTVNFFDANIVSAVYESEAHGSEAANHTELADNAQAELDDLNAKAEAEAAEAAAKAAAAAEEAAKIANEVRKATNAANAAVKDPKTAAEKLLWQAKYDEYFDNKDMKADKKAAENAKKQITVAQKAAYALAQNAVLNAQEYAYETMTAEINKAVNEYLAGVQEAIGDFYFDLYLG